MYCRKCGTNNADEAKFCANCGAEMSVKRPVPEDSIKKKEGKNGLKIVLFVLLVVLLMASVIVAVIIASQKKKEKDFQTQIEAGESYLEDMEYEKAEDYYLAAIEIDPKEEEPYLRLAEIYTVQNEPEKAVEILEQGIEATESEKLEEQYNLYTYVEEELIPEIGQAKTGVYEWEFPASNYRRTVAPLDEVSGVITSRIMDFDNDGDNELLVAIMKNDAETDDFSGKHNAVYLEMYENEDGDIVKTAEMLACDGVLGGRCEEMSGVFLKKADDIVYICGGDYGAELYDEERNFFSFVVTYEEEEFQKYTGTDERMYGTYFYAENDKGIDDMADKLDAIGLSKTADDVRSTSMMRMTFYDEVDDYLFRIGSEYANYVFQRKEDGGVSVIHFWLGTEETEIVKELSEADLLELLDEYGYYEEGEPTYTEGMTGASRLSFGISDPVEDMGEYYLANVKVYDIVKVPADTKVGDEVTVVLNELTGETETWICKEETEYALTFYSATDPQDMIERTAGKKEEIDGMLPVYWYSADAVNTLIYEGEIAIMKTASDEIHITQSTYLVNEDLFEGEYDEYRNCVYFNEKGYVERMVYYGD